MPNRSAGTSCSPCARRTFGSGAIQNLTRRLLELSLFAKVLIANSLIVALGAVAGTYLTTEHVRGSPEHTHYEMMVLFGSAGLVLSVAINALVLRAAFAPLTQLERTARRVSGGKLDARVRLGAIRDPETATLAESFNHMLDTIQADARRLEEYSVRLHELSDQVLLAQEDERRRLARELHDQTGQELSTLLLGLKLFRDAAARPNPDLPALRTQAAELGELARSTLDGVRTLALELRPRMLDDLGLATALRAYVDEWSARARVPVEFTTTLEGTKLPSNTEIAVYRLVQEALVNVAKHADASHVTVRIERRDGELTAEVRDDGRGMELPHLPHQSSQEPRGNGAPRLDERSAGGGLSAGLGLFGAQERVALVGGQFTLESAPGQGTTVRAVIPLTGRGE
jgi:two-component system sensor histidine kinase UhpB